MQISRINPISFQGWVRIKNTNDRGEVIWDEMFNTDHFIRIGANYAKEKINIDIRSGRGQSYYYDNISSSDMRKIMNAFARVVKGDEKYAEVEVLN